jgi:hypothetical protein
MFFQDCPDCQIGTLDKTEHLLSERSWFWIAGQNQVVERVTLFDSIAFLSGYPQHYITNHMVPFDGWLSIRLLYCASLLYCYNILTSCAFYQNKPDTISASSRISKGQGYQGFLRKRAGSSFGQKRAIGVVQRKTRKIYRISLLLKCFPISFNTFKTP